MFEDDSAFRQMAQKLSGGRYHVKRKYNKFNPFLYLLDTRLLVCLVLKNPEVPGLIDMACW
jgi:hypothetical protein